MKRREDISHKIVMMDTTHLAQVIIIGQLLMLENNANETNNDSTNKV